VPEQYLNPDSLDSRACVNHFTVFTCEASEAQTGVEGMREYERWKGD